MIYFILSFLAKSLNLDISQILIFTNTVFYSIIKTSFKSFTRTISKVLLACDLRNYWTDLPHPQNGVAS